MNWRIEERDAFEVFGIERVCRNDETMSLGWFWDECLSNGNYDKLEEAGNGGRFADNEQHTVGAICGYCDTGVDTFPYMLCVLKKLDSITDGFKVAQVPKATWAVFRSGKNDHIGLEIPVLFSRAYSEWLPSSGFDKSPGPDMEIYYTDLDGKHFEEVWIPVTKR